MCTCEFSGATHGPLECGSLTCLSAFEYAETMPDEYAVGALAVANLNYQNDQNHSNYWKIKTLQMMVRSAVRVVA